MSTRTKAEQPARPQGTQGADPHAETPGVQTPETTPAEERGERIATGKAIARGGKTEGAVPGAEPSSGEKQ